MSAHVLLKLRKSNKMRGLPSILSLFRNMFNKFNKTSARMLDSIYHMTLKLLKNSIFGVKIEDFVIYYTTLNWTSLLTLQNLKTISGLLILLHGIISLPVGMSCDKWLFSRLWLLYLSIHVPFFSPLMLGPTFNHIIFFLYIFLLPVFA